METPALKSLPFGISFQMILRKCVNFKVICFSASNSHRLVEECFWGYCGSSCRKRVWKSQNLTVRGRRRTGRQVRPTSWHTGFRGSEGRSLRLLGSALSRCKVLIKTKLGEDTQKILKETKGL